jgi:hypothetical protein
MLLSTANQVLSALAAFNDWSLTFRGSRAPFFMTKDKTPKQVADSKECNRLINDLRDLNLGDYRNRDGKIHEFKDNLFFQMISFAEATKLINDAHNLNERAQDPPPPPDRIDTSGSA